MKILELVQGTDAWHLHRATHFNASDAPAMLGVSPYKSRDQLIREKATGITPDIDAGTQQRFNDGHRYEALARPLAEDIVGEDLFPCVGSFGKFSASFDGLTMLGDVVFEHKSLNDTLRAAMRQQGGNANDFLPEVYLVQMEHQCMVSGAVRVLFMASKWSGDELVEERNCWYAADASRRARIVAGWGQFETDVAAYQPDTTSPVVVASGHAPEQLPALRIEVTGMVTASNLAEFKAHAMGVLGNINRDLHTDEDFANAEQTVKWAKDVEERLEAAKQHALSQTSSIEALFRTIDDISAETRRIRLELDRQVTKQKESRRAEIVMGGVNAVRAHYDEINATFGQHALSTPAGLSADIGAAIKSKKTLSSIHDAVNAAVANAKITASQQAERVRANVAILAEHPDHVSLFADCVTLCATKSPDDLRNLVAARLSDNAERERARQAEIDRQKQIEQAAPTAPSSAYTSASAAQRSMTTPAIPATQRTSAKIKLGEINQRIAPLAINEAGLAALGFHPVGTDRAAKLYASDDLAAMCQSMIAILTAAALPGEAVRMVG